MIQFKIKLFAFLVCSYLGSLVSRYTIDVLPEGTTAAVWESQTKAD